MKGVSTVLSAVIIVAIGLALTSAAYLWGVPLIQKRQEASTTDKIYSQFLQTNQNSLPKTIEDVANNRGIKTFTANSEGVWILDENEESIAFFFTTKTSNIAADTQNPISLSSGVQCTGTTPPDSPSPPNGTLGQDSASVVCVSATTLTDAFTIKYKIWFRELSDNPFSPTQRFKIDLEKDQGGLTTSTGKTVRITFGDSTQDIVSGQTLITKKVKILLI